MMSMRASVISPAAAEFPVAQSVGEIVQSNPGGDHYRKLARTGNPRWCGGTVIDRGSTGPVEDSIGLVVAGAVEPDQAE
jgi:hypothetical protein